jgi:hypothetical protein
MMAKRKPESDLPRTMAEFDAWHALRPERWEFIAGRPVMMAPASKRPTVVKANIARHLGNKLAGKPCRTYAEGVEIKTGVLSAIPDVVVECGTIDFATPAVAEPVLIVEVLSPYTEGDDIGRKWQGYCLYTGLAALPRCGSGRPLCDAPHAHWSGLVRRDRIPDGSHRPPRVGYFDIARRDLRRCDLRRLS